VTSLDSYLRCLGKCRAANRR